MESRLVANAAFATRHVSGLAQADLPLREAAARLFRQLSEALRCDAILPLQEKIYGPAADREEILRIRAEVFEQEGLDPGLPCTYTTGRLDEDLGLAGFQIWGVTPNGEADVRVATVTSPEGVSGRLLEGPGLRMLFLSAVRGTHPDGSLPTGVAEQAERMFQNADSALSEHGFSFRNVPRTWIYLRRILDWYGEFNRVRLAFLQPRGFTGGKDSLPFPASTGIQGTGGTEECLMDVLAVEGETPEAATVRAIQESSRQDEPFAYGSSFSRGMALSYAGQELILVSGTASIDSAGHTLHGWEREAQILETLLSIAALLEDQGAGLKDIRSATLFCKDRETLDVFQRVTRQLGVEGLPVIPVLADVCRHELMVEIEALAVVPEEAGTPKREGSS